MQQSIGLIEAAQLDAAARIIDIGGGASTLVDDLLAMGYENITVLDISASALDQTETRLGERARFVN